MLVFCDVHANLPAMEAVIDDARPFDACIFLGDVVGGGPEPGACVQLLRDLNPAVLIMGNHDHEALSSVAADTVEPDHIDNWKDWETWTGMQLSEASRKYLRCAAASRSITLNGRRIHLTHHPEAVRQGIGPSTSIGLLRRAVAGVTEDECWFGHSHMVMDRQVSGVRLLNPGSVGQPRDGAPVARYALWDEGRVSFHGVMYDVERTVAALARVPLSVRLLNAWRRNLREGCIGPDSV